MTNVPPFRKKRNLNRQQLAVYKKTLKLTEIQKQVIIGTLLADSSISLRNGRPHYSIKFEHGEAQREYINHLYTIFEPYCGSSPADRWIDRNQTRKAVWFRTYQHDDIIFYYNLFYEYDPVNRTSRKRIPKNIANFLTPLAIAHMYMGDGTNTDYAYEINSQGFDENSVKYLCNALTEKYGLKTSYQKDRKIRIWAESSQHFTQLIKPYILPIFEYKIKKY